MKFLDNENTNIIEENKCCYENKEYDTILDNLQAAITTLNDSLDNLQAELSSSVKTLKGDISTAEIKAAEKLSNEITSINSTIKTLSDNLSRNVITENLKADTAEIEAETANKADINSLTAQTAEIAEANIKSSKAETAEITEAVIGTLKATAAEIENLNTKNFTFENLETAQAKIDEIVSSVGTITSLYTDLITATDDNWQTPNTAPDNTELLAIHIPNYDGIVNVITKEGQFNVSILNGALATYSQRDFYIYRISFKENESVIYLQKQEGISYKLLKIGKEEKIISTSEIVDRAFYDRNIPELNGSIAKKLTDETAENPLQVSVVDKLPIGGMKNVIYIVNGDKSYYCNGKNYYSLTSDIVDDLDFSGLFGE